MFGSGSSGFARSAVVVVLSVAVGFLISARFDLFEWMFQVTRDYESWQLDEVLMVAFFAAAGLAFSYWRSLKRSEEKFRQGESRFRAFLERAADAIFIIRVSGEITDANRRACESLGYSREELIGRNIKEIEVGEESEPGFPDDERETAGLRAGESVTVERVQRRKDGGTFPVEVRSEVFEMDGETFWMSIARDVSERNEAIRRLKSSEARNRMILESIPDLVFRFSRSGEFLDFHAGDTRDLYVSRDNILGRRLEEILPRDLAEEALSHISAALDGVGTQCFEYRLDLPDGLAHFEARLVKSGPGEVTCFSRDITEQNDAIENLRTSEARNRAALEAIPDAVFRFSRSGEYLDVHVNKEFRAYDPDGSFIGRTIEDVLPPDGAKEFMRAIPEVLDTGEKRELEYEITAGGENFHREARLVKSGSGEVMCFVRDIGERKEFESKIRRLAYHDDLTGLPNRTSFMERLSDSLEAPERGGKAMVILKLRGFERVNDSLGREAGDRLLAMVAGHVREFFGGRGEVARFGGDEFAALLEGFASFEEALELIAEGQRTYPNMPFLLDELEVFLRADIGVALVEGGDEPNEVVRKASVALLEAQGEPEADYKVFDREMGEKVLARMHLERDLRLALEYGQIEVHYQPEVFLSSGGIYSFEALARWNHPELGPVSPVVFIPIAEESGLILRLGEYVLEEACRRMRFWRESLPGSAPCSVSVNISAVQLRQRDLVSRIIRILDENGLQPACLQLEITESAAMEDLDSAVRIFDELREFGVRVALDDFGTGYSSLSCLRQFPLDALKVDRSFIQGLEGDPQMANVIASIIELAHALDLKVVSEGIETPGQLAMLRRLGCDIGQGFHFSRALPPGEAFDLLSSWQTLDLLR